MARFDNRSINQPVLMFGSDDLTAGGATQTSAVIDTALYDAGYTIAANAVGFSTGSIDMVIQTSDSSSSGFTDVATDKLIGGVIPSLVPALFNGEGSVSVSRGVVDDRRFVRVQFTNPSSLPVSGLAFFVAINGAVEGAPPSEAEGTVISV